MRQQQNRAFCNGSRTVKSSFVKSVNGAFPDRLPGPGFDFPVCARGLVVAGDGMGWGWDGMGWQAAAVILRDFRFRVGPTKISEFLDEMKYS